MQGLEKIACSNKRTGGIKIAKVEVADPGKGPWGTLYFSTKMRPEELRKNFLETPLPLSQGLDDSPVPPPPPIFEGLDLPLSIVAERAGWLTNFDKTKENHRKSDFNYFYSLTLKFLLGVKFHLHIIISKAKIIRACACACICSVSKECRHEKKMKVRHHAQGTDCNSRQGQKMKHVETLEKNSLEQMPKFEGVVVR